ncbi:hypothetical protein Pint_01056 [Pistacia integerrima]|uniref:Uncharacterized protein n=1 Tax=Pistacia integerrima TaxID=434235 RepID=A0ACC0ZI48_9ROSI|nr:hypothetical protein Pint_01056 [Pistacia integerrima]
MTQSMGSVQKAFDMGKLICSEIAEGGLDLMGLIMALVIALTLMLVCVQPPPRPRYIVSAYPVAVVRK